MKISIMQKNPEVCYLCGRNGSMDPLECHHVFFGKNRKLSDEDGLVVWLCGSRCHREGKWSVHQNHKVDQMLKEDAQAAWESHYGTREDFIKRYGKNYL